METPPTPEPILTLFLGGKLKNSSSSSSKGPYIFSKSFQWASFTFKSLNAISVPHCKSQGLIIKKERKEKREGDYWAAPFRLLPIPAPFLSVARIENGFRSAPILASVNGREDEGGTAEMQQFRHRFSSFICRHSWFRWKMRSDLKPNHT